MKSRKPTPEPQATQEQEAFRQTLSAELLSAAWLREPGNALQTVRHILVSLAKFRERLDERTLKAAGWEMCRLALLNQQVELRGAGENLHDYRVDFKDGTVPDLSDAKHSQRGSATAIRFDDTDNSRLSKVRELSENPGALGLSKRP